MGDTICSRSSTFTGSKPALDQIRSQLGEDGCKCTQHGGGHVTMSRDIELRLDVIWALTRRLDGWASTIGANLRRLGRGDAARGALRSRPKEGARGTSGVGRESAGRPRRAVRSRRSRSRTATTWIAAHKKHNTRLQEVDCRSTCCTAAIEFPSYGQAMTSYSRRVAQSFDMQCAQTAQPPDEPEDPAGPFASRSCSSTAPREAVRFPFPVERDPLGRRSTPHPPRRLQRARRSRARALVQHAAPAPATTSGWVPRSLESSTVARGVSTPATPLPEW